MGKRKKCNSDSDSESSESNTESIKKTRKFYNYMKEFEDNDIRKKINALLIKYYNYSDDNNPFGDPELSKPFIWHNKIKKLRYNGQEPILDTQTLLYKIKESKTEIENIMKSRKTRENIKAQELEKYKKNEKSIDEFEEKDKKFYLAQENLRSEIRIKQGRERPIDFLNKVIMTWKGLVPVPKDFDEIPEYQKPYKLYEILDTKDLNELHKEMNLRLQIDNEKLKNKSFVCFNMDNFRKQNNISEDILKEFILFWNSMLTLLQSHLNPEFDLNKLSNDQTDSIMEIIKEKKLSEYDELEELIISNLETETSPSDLLFWKNTLFMCRINRCQLTIDSIYEEFKQKHVNIHLNKPAEVSDEDDDNLNLSPPMYESDEDFRRVALTEHDYLIKLSETRKHILAQQLAKWQKNLIESSTCKNVNVNINTINTINKPKLVKIDNKKVNLLSKYLPYDDEENVNTKNEEEGSDDEAENYLNKFKKKTTANKPKITSIPSNMNLIVNQISQNIVGIDGVKASRFYLGEEAAVESSLLNDIKEIESEQLGEGETVFNDVVQLCGIDYTWAQNYKPRRPRYFNKIKMGYEWNKYNQLHYDYDNPPPKVIQGYKFNIFYPDLIDKTKAPQYFLERSDTPETCIIRFNAGAPYEDIAFKIINREWDMHDKAGFQCHFDRGILYLYFNFKRYRYKH